VIYIINPSLFIYSAEAKEDFVYIVYNSIEAKLEILSRHYYHHDDKDLATSLSLSSLSLSGNKIPTKVNISHIQNIINNKNGENTILIKNDFKFVLTHYYNKVIARNNVYNNNNNNNNNDNDDRNNKNNRNYNYNNSYHHNITTYLEQLHNKIITISDICQSSQSSLSACISAHVSDDIHNITEIITQRRYVLVVVIVVVVVVVVIVVNSRSISSSRSRSSSSSSCFFSFVVNSC